MKGAKSIVLGWDGATWDLLLPLVEQGLMPHLQRLIKQGATGIMESTIPPLTPTAWMSIYTGMNPGKHGVFSFSKKPRQAASAAAIAQIELISSIDAISFRLWHLLNVQGIRTGLINLPLTFPAEKINGFMLTGMMTPGGLTRQGNSYPDDLISELETAIGCPYLVDVSIEGSDDDFIRRLDELLTIREKTIEYLIANKSWDVFWVVFVTPDRIQHRYWKYLDPKSNHYHTERGAGLREKLLPLYQRLDDELGKLMDRVDRSTTFYLISDHGFGPLQKAIYLNLWLRDQGYLKAKSELGWIRVFLKSMNRGWIKKVIPLGSLYKLREQNKSVIDWSGTVAYAGTPDVQGVFFNVVGREPNGVVNPGAEYEALCDVLRSRLQELVDPRDGSRLFERVYRNDELFNGERSINGPDLIVVTAEEQYGVSDNLFERNIVKSLENAANGAHRQRGVFAAFGPRIISDKKLDTTSVVDFAPTLLHSLGLSVPSEMDGDVIMEIFVDSDQDVQPMKRVPLSDYNLSLSHNPAEQPIYSNDQASELTQRLKALGYLDE